MPRRYFLSWITSLVILVSPPSKTEAQCVSDDFGSFAVGMPITTHVEAVVISVVPQSCGNTPFLHARVADDFFGQAFTSRALVIDSGCPDFSDDYLRLIFTDKQRDVRFTLGPWAGTYFVRAYEAVVGGAPAITRTIIIPGTGFVGANFPVQVVHTSRDLRRIEIEASGSGHEAIDNLSFGQDSTPPLVIIETPTPLECITGEITITGTSCDGDGAYDRDRLEYLRVWPDPQNDWTLVREYVGQQVCDSFSLYAFDTTEPEITDGTYVLRATATNDCAMTGTDSVTVHVDNGFDSLELERPEHGAIVGGSVCFDGTAFDPACFDRYVVAYRSTQGGPWLPVDQTHPIYSAAVTRGTLAQWTSAQGLPDGEYTVALAGYTTTGADASRQILLTLDNTAPQAEISTPTACDVVDGAVEIVGTAFDEQIIEWSLHYFDPGAGTWSYINDDSNNIINGQLATWDTGNLDPCFYTLRLRVTDQAIVDGCGTARPHVTDAYVTVAVGTGGSTDLDADGDTDLADYVLFLAGFHGPLP